MEKQESIRPEKCPRCLSTKIYKGPVIARPKLNIKSRRWRCFDCGKTFYQVSQSEASL